MNHVQKQQNVETDANQDNKTAAHQNAFSGLLEFVQERVIGHHKNCATVTIAGTVRKRTRD